MMVKKAILLLTAVAGIACTAEAQQIRCGTDEHHRSLIEQYPKVAEIQRAMDLQWRGALLKTTADVDDYLAKFQADYEAEIADTLIVPVVVHVIHDYASEYVPDTVIYRMIKEMNEVYQAANPDISSVITPFKKYIGRANIEFRLAQKDPVGNPTNGITRRQSPLTDGGDDQAKIGQWAPNRYLNIWVEKVIGRGVTQGEVLAYATLPSGAAANPYSDGIIAKFANLNDKTKTISHEVGHYLNLYHPWNSSQVAVAQACGDDEVDDTPPTKGHFSTCPLYDSTCAQGYTKTYMHVDTAGNPVPVVVDYPDTTNVQNIMDYSSCTNMFTQQQVLRMRQALKSPVGNRNQLITATTHKATGVLEPRKDLTPIAAFSVEKPRLASERAYYMCYDAAKDFTFQNRSWRDTITSVSWSFTNGGQIISSGDQINSPIEVKFTSPGWATVTLTATGNNSGTGTTEETAVYVADPNYILNPYSGYTQEFDEQGDREKWPSFNYFVNDAGWKIVNNTGFYDNYSIMYSGFDMRTYPNNLINSLKGDYDDFFTPAFDLSAMKGAENCNLNFMSSGAARTDNVNLMNDVLQISYSVDCGASWRNMDSLKKAEIANKGTYQLPYAPLWMGDWKLQSLNIPEAARTNKTFFRFRYRPSVSEQATQIANGNNFYIDRINVSPYPLGVNTVVSDKNTITIAPNPANGSSYVIISSTENSSATIQVTDLTGKVVYRTQENLNNKYNRIEIPASAIAVKGIYMVQVVTGSQTHTEKLVSY